MKQLIVVAIFAVSSLGASEEVPALTTSQIREVDRIAMRETGPSLFQMMENADRSLAEMALERLCGDWQKARLC
jgi:NAD(P)H-hydrate repair Nnr-like enzyme with NAD(P)H-hydrate epimerase domain